MVAAGPDHGLDRTTLMSARYSQFTQRVIAVIKSVPRGRIATYRDIALYAGYPRAARQVAWILHIMSDKKNLPWHRIVNHRQQISLPPCGGYEEQRAMLFAEGVSFGRDGRTILKRHQWRPTRRQIISILKHEN